MFHQVLLKPFSELVYPIISLIIHLWITFAIICVLILKDGLEIFHVLLLMCVKLKKIAICVLQFLCFNNSLVWSSFLNEVEESFPKSFFSKHSYKEKQSVVGTATCQEQIYELSPKSEHSGQYMCQSCQIMSEVLLRYKNLSGTSHDTHSPVLEVFKNSVGTQTAAESEIVNVEHSHVQTSTDNSIISIFGKEGLDSPEFIENRFKKHIAVNCEVFPVRYPSSPCDCQRNTSSRSQSPMESEKHESSPANQNDSRRIIPEEFVEIPLESPTNVSQLLESPVCQINLESMRNLQLRFSQEICSPRLSPKQKSIFSWNKLALMQKATKRFIEMKKMKQENDAATSREPVVKTEPANIPNQREMKSSTTEDESDVIGCCSYILHRLKSKFDPKVANGSVVYTKF